MGAVTHSLVKSYINLDDPVNFIWHKLKALDNLLNAATSQFEVNSNYFIVIARLTRPG